ncbi:nodulation S family protein [Ancylobacter sp. A5.8]|uniref:class I SAM-dependent DNA methyltransferase n=1 Tax=Ancylobacter gelatini TaxID=2919920 RepID=UPI001F4DF2A0|nr:SAM-dependent methyltransferase [Ancylobacter gelatini]MCJ8142241.1 nodulation S family protein [Ancylobacter gelatini]
MTQRANNSLPPTYFDALYAADADPWRFETSAYERAKYEATLAALPMPRSTSALEIGCSIGVLTARLAPRCDRLRAVDVSSRALDIARRRCGELPQVSFEEVRVPQQWPDGTFDLILLSEVLYYLDRDDLARLAAQVSGALQPGGAVMMVHWLGETDYPLSGDAAVEHFMRELTRQRSARVVRRSREAEYRLDCLVLG